MTTDEVAGFLREPPPEPGIVVPVAAKRRCRPPSTCRSRVAWTLCIHSPCACSAGASRRTMRSASCRPNGVAGPSSLAARTASRHVAASRMLQSPIDFRKLSACARAPEEYWRNAPMFCYRDARSPAVHAIEHETFVACWPRDLPFAVVVRIKRGSQVPVAARWPPAARNSREVANRSQSRVAARAARPPFRVPGEAA